MEHIKPKLTVHSIEKITQKKTEKNRKKSQLNSIRASFRYSYLDNTTIYNRLERFNYLQNEFVLETTQGYNNLVLS